VLKNIKEFVITHNFIKFVIENSNKNKTQLTDFETFVFKDIHIFLSKKITLKNEKL